MSARQVVKVCVWLLLNIATFAGRDRAASQPNPNFYKMLGSTLQPGSRFSFYFTLFYGCWIGTLKFHAIEVTPLYTKFRKFLGLRKFSPCYIGNTFEHKIFGIFVWVQIIIESCLQTTHRNISWSLLLYEI